MPMRGIGTQPQRSYQPAIAIITLALVGGALLRYYPAWSESYVKFAGIIEGANPPRMIVGRRGVWQDLRRERQILAVQRRTHAALLDEVRAAGAPVLTDIPGIAAQAGQISRLQAFEHSQTLQLWDQRSLRVDLANGRVPLVVLDYLGNWLTPEVIELIRHRYAQEGSRGTYDMYRPVDTGQRTETRLDLSEGLRVSAYYLASPTYHAGEIAVLTLEIQPQTPAALSIVTSPEVQIVLVVRNANGAIVLQDTRPLIYGAIDVREIPTEGVQHMQPLRLPDMLVPGAYTIEVALDAGDDVQGQHLADLTISPQTGSLLADGWREQGEIYVPAPILALWQQLGGEPRLGMPISPAVPFQHGTQQCFERGCLRQQSTRMEQIPLGVWLAAGDIGANQALANPAISPAFASFYQTHGGASMLGTAVTNEFRSGDRIVQYTEFARLERPIEGGDSSFGSIGEDILRLPGGEAYRWP